MSLSSFLSYPPTNTHRHPSRRQCLIYFIPGNPGLIDYYQPFLSTLRTLLDAADDDNDDPDIPGLGNDTTSSTSGISYHIHGQTLAGFIDSSHSPFTPSEPPYNVAHQIRYTLSTLSSLRITEPSSRAGRPFDQILLMGHSLGAYIALEVIHSLLFPPTPHISTLHAHLLPALNTSILLFPTISDIALSPSGRRLAFLGSYKLLREHLLYRLAKLALWPCPRGMLEWICRYVLRYPEHAARVTASWLVSRDGVWQSLWLGMDEMDVIGSDERWGDDLWEVVRDSEGQGEGIVEVDGEGKKEGVLVDVTNRAKRTSTDTSKTQVDGTTQSRPPKQTRPPGFVLFFGQNDPWVANRIRDRFIEKRERNATRFVGESPRTKIVVDEGKLPHSFCLDYSEVMAEKVSTWVQELTDPLRHSRAA